MGTKTSYLSFPHTGWSKSQKTKVWGVVNTYEGREIMIGQVKWYGPWRKYAFFPLGANTVFEHNCLREIADFIEEQTGTHYGR